MSEIKTQMDLHSNEMNRVNLRFAETVRERDVLLAENGRMRLDMEIVEMQLCERT
jgi:hypothetical protein